MSETEKTRLSNRLFAWSQLLSVGRLASEPQAVTRSDLYNVNKLMHEIANGLADEGRRLQEKQI